MPPDRRNIPCFGQDNNCPSRLTVVLQQWLSVVIGSTNGNYFRQWLLVWLTVSHKTFMVITTFLTPPPSHCCWEKIVKLGSWSISNFHLKCRNSKEDQSWRYNPNAPPTTHPITFQLQYKGQRSISNINLQCPKDI